MDTDIGIFHLFVNTFVLNTKYSKLEAQDICSTDTNRCMACRIR
jgi:hypothetical protein